MDVTHVLRLVNSLRSSAKSFFRWPDSIFRPLSFELEPASIGHFPQVEPSLEDEKSKGFLWGVPKKRRTLERRFMRKYGFKEWHWKPFIPKTNIRICDTCGNHYELKHLCRHCYDRIVAETNVIRQAAEAKLGHSPEDKNIIVLYENELQTSEIKGTENDMIVEVAKPRPSWFSKNLLQKSTAGIDKDSTSVTTDSTTIKPLA